MTNNDHILISAGGIKLAIESSAVHCIHESLTAQAEQGTQDWFLGVAVADERLLPVTDLGAYLHGDNALGRVVEVSRDLGIAGLKIDDVHSVSRTEPQAHKNDASDGNSADGTPIQNKLDETPLLNLVITEQGQHYHVMDMAKLMQSKRFLNVKKASA